MLDRFTSIAKVGLFDAYTNELEGGIGELALIFGENGVGKSTLAAILDSLRENNPAEVIRRRSLPGDIAPQAVVRFGGKDYTFDGSHWDVELPHDTLEVFYPGFVTRNVHAATTVGVEHRRHLCEFVLGRTAVKKVGHLAEADDRARAALGEIKTIEKQLQTLIKAPDTLDTFSGMARDPEIEKHLEEARSELKHARSRDAILKRSTPSAVVAQEVDRDALASALETSATNLDPSTRARIADHISRHLDEHGEAWLGYGARHIGPDRTCPFCGQDLATSDLVKAITSYFSEAYRVYAADVVDRLGIIRRDHGTAALNRLRGDISIQIDTIRLWADEIPADVTQLSALLAEVEAHWTAAATKLDAVLAQKEAAVAVRLDAAVAGDALGDYDRTRERLGVLNEALTRHHDLTEAKKVSLSTADTKALEARINSLENRKARHEPLAEGLLEKRNLLLAERRTLDAEKTALKGEIDAHAATVVGKYQSGINHYLALFGCDARIDSVEPTFPSGKASVQYVLKLNGHIIELGVSSAVPCFETVLSEGDKCTLALAFFFARLKDMNSLAGRTIVLDDPVNSFGSARRGFVESVIRDLRKRGAQVVVLTHDERFAAAIWRGKGLKTSSTLQVVRTSTGSGLQPWDIERATQSEYVKNYLALRTFLDNGDDHEVAAKCIRPYVEQRLRHLFPGPPFMVRDSLGVMIGAIKASAPGSRLSGLQEQLEVLSAINDATLPSHHASDDALEMEPLTPEGARIFAEKALAVLG